MPLTHQRCILGVNFFTGPIEDAVAFTLHGDNRVGSGETAKIKKFDGSEGSELKLNLEYSSGAPNARLVVAPSAPGLAADLIDSASYREALVTADLALTDSGFMVLLWRLFTGEKIPRHSGLKFLRAVLERPELKQPGSVFWVMPSAQDDARNRFWLVARGFPVTEDDVYIAPHYPAGDVVDEELVRRIDARRPRIVMLAIGGGVQERVGLMLRGKLSACSPSVLCLGAAIAFLTGGQANIPPWADRLVLGWLMRLISDPRRFWRRYWIAIALAPLLRRHRDRLPPMRGA